MITPFRQFIQRLHRLFDDTTLSSTQRQQQSAQLLKNLIQQKHGYRRLTLNLAGAVSSAIALCRSG